MALTGLVMVGFVVAHMVGNLKAFAGIDHATGLYKLDEYAALLRELGAPLIGRTTLLWLARFGLLAAVVLHIVSAVQLRMRIMRARPINYQTVKYRASNFASRMMAVGGAVLLLFIIGHILHFTTGTLHFQGFAEGRVYTNVFRAFSIGGIVGLYVVAIVFLGIHLYHGVWSMFQTLGVQSAELNLGIRCVAQLLAVIVTIGFLSVPLGVYFGVIPAPVAITSVAMSVSAK